MWSVARYILTTSRTKMAHIVFEAILFLRMNRALWDERKVMEALVAVRADQKDERLKKKLELANEQEENEEGDVELWVMIMRSSRHNRRFFLLNNNKCQSIAILGVAILRYCNAWVCNS